jgi:hypothetical protein
MLESLEIHNPLQGIHGGLNKESGLKYFASICANGPLIHDRMDE